MPPPIPKRGHWHAARRERATPERRPYRDPAPDPAAPRSLAVEESGTYQALREHCLVAWLRRMLTR